MAFDPVARNMALFGGFDTNFNSLNDTRVGTGATEPRSILQTRPLPSFHSVAYESKGTVAPFGDVTDIGQNTLPKHPNCLVPGDRYRAGKSLQNSHVYRFSW
jgi:hypothetical protein